MNRLKVVLVAAANTTAVVCFLALCGRLGAEPACAKPNTIQSRCDASGQPSRVSPRLRVSASRTTVVAALPRTADRGSQAKDAAVGHARPAIAVATPDSPIRMRSARDRNTPVSQRNRFRKRTSMAAIPSVRRKTMKVQLVQIAGVHNFGE